MWFRLEEYIIMLVGSIYDYVMLTSTIFVSTLFSYHGVTPGCVGNKVLLNETFYTGAL